MSGMKNEQWDWYFATHLDRKLMRFIIIVAAVALIVWLVLVWLT
jgi:hypothetical protein